VEKRERERVFSRAVLVLAVVGWFAASLTIWWLVRPPVHASAAALVERETVARTSATVAARPAAPRADDSVTLSGDAGVPATPLRSPQALPWQRPGLCGERAPRGLAELRTTYLRTFVSIPAGSATLWVHPSLASDVRARIRDDLERTHAEVTKRLGLSAVSPPIYVYPSADELRKHSCASANADAYYDGAIHLAVIDASLVKVGARTAGMWATLSNLTHEYVHHVLVSNGIGKPIWFQEGSALWIAGKPADYWQTWRRNPIVLDRMVDTFPTTGAPADGAVFYAQAYVMTDFLERLCEARRECGLAELAQALKSGVVTPERLFAWAVSRRGEDLIRTTPLPLWDDYAERGNFSPETLQVLWHRKPPAN